MSEYNTESNNSDSKEPRRFGDSIPSDPERQAELVEQSVQRYLETQRYLEQEAKEYLSRSVYYDHFGVDHGDE
jgi:hypothetical protein